VSGQPQALTDLPPGNMGPRSRLDSFVEEKSLVPKAI